MMDGIFRRTDYFIFDAIAGQHDRGGADESIIVDAVDYFQRLVLTLEELEGGIQRLLAHGAIDQRAGKFLISAVHAPSLPRTPKGEVSFAKKVWARYVRDVLGEYGS